MSTKILSKLLIGLPMLAIGATPVAAAVCPTIGTFSSGCSALITRSSTGVYSVVSTGVGPYDGNDDSLVGFVNNGNNIVTSLTLSGNDIFGFDGDGINTFAGGGNYGPTGYEGPNTSFTIVDANNGKVNFIGGVAPGATAYFALESNLSNASGPPIGVTPGTPEPATWAMMLVGFGSIGAVMRRRATTVTYA